MEEKVVKFYSIILLIFLLAVTIYLLSSYSFSLNNRVLIVNETKNNDVIIINSETTSEEENKNDIIENEVINSNEEKNPDENIINDNLDNNTSNNNGYNLPSDDLYQIDNISNEQARAIFLNKNAVVVGDSMGEGLSCYGVLNNESVVWHRGRRVDNMNLDLPTLIQKNPSYLFLAYGANDLKMLNGNVQAFIQNYKNAIENIKNALPNTKIIINSILPTSSNAILNDNCFSYQSLFNEELKKLAIDQNVDFLENSYFLNDESFSSDGIHPKSYFFFLWARHMASYLDSN
ncbi:MAG: GDSL-type esterase/lipase family protein [bacterium]|nr:GDSL-type esterase/lipase family protein [bacterium]